MSSEPNILKICPLYSVGVIRLTNRGKYTGFFSSVNQHCFTTVTV